MKTKHSGAYAGTLATTLALGILCCPTPAFAEGAADASILVPKPAEFIPALVAFLVIWFVLAKKAWPQILKALDARQEKIQSDLDEADATKQKAAEELKEYEQKIAAAQQQADDIIAEAKRTAEEQRSQVRAQAQKEAADIITNAHNAVENERRSAMIDLTDSVANLSVQIASKIIDENLDEDKQRKLIEKYLTEVGSFHAD